MSIRTRASNSLPFETLTLSVFAPSSSGARSNVSSPLRPSDSADSPSGNCSGRMPIPTRFERWMRSYDSASTKRTPSSRGPFAAQSRDEPEPYSLPASTHSGVSSSWYSSAAS